MSHRSDRMIRVSDEPLWGRSEVGWRGESASVSFQTNPCGVEAPA
ncbi:hypothetical protein NJ7G_3318 [Natrinema sp. J7-2]|nr:hypothetical protein NJ7G_3318 [Natrinema sp. J7-2]